MRKIVALITLIVLAATLVVPVAALAVGPPPGKGPESTPPGLQKKADKAEAKGQRMRARGDVDGSPGKSAEAPGRAQMRSAEETATPGEGAPAAEGRQKGRANALSRIMRNIERAEARVEAGEKSQVPPGLLDVMSKFLGWLGVDSDSETPTVERDLE